MLGNNLSKVHLLGERIVNVLDSNWEHICNLSFGAGKVKLGVFLINFAH